MNCNVLKYKKFIKIKGLKMKNIYEVFLKDKFNFVKSAKLIKSILEPATSEEKIELQKEMIQDLDKDSEVKLFDNLEIFRKINFKLKHQKKKNMNDSFTAEEVKDFNFIYNELISLAIIYLKNEKNLKVSNVLYLIAIDEHTPKPIYELLKENKNYVKVDCDIIKNFYWLSAQTEKLSEFKSSWKEINSYIMGKSLNDVLRLADDAKVELQRFLIEKNSKKVNQNDGGNSDVFERKLKQSKTLGILYLHVLELYINKETPNNAESKIRVERLLENDIFSNYGESPFIIKTVKQIAEAYKKICPDGELPTLNRYSKKALPNLNFIFAINCKNIYQKNDFMNLLAQKNRNEIINNEFKSTLNKKGMLSADSVLNVSKVSWHKNTQFEDIKVAFDFQGVPLSSKEWMIITLSADEKSCSDEAICYLNERRYKEDVKEDGIQKNVVIRPRLKF